MNLAVRDIRQNRWRFIQTCVGLGMLIAIVIIMGGIYRGLIFEATVVLRAVGADIWVVQQGTEGPFASASRLPEDVENGIAAVPGVAEAAGISFQNIQIRRGGTPLRFFLVGYTPGRLGGPPSITAGRKIRQSHYEMVADEKMRVGLGETIRLGLDDYTVVGLTRDMVGAGGDPCAYVTLADAQAIQFKEGNDAVRNGRARIAENLARLPQLTPAQATQLAPVISEIVGSTHIVNAVAARLSPGADLAAVQDSIERWNHYRAISTAEEEEILSMGLIQKAKVQLGLFRIILLIIAAVIITLIIYTMTMEKIRVIATLKLIGAPGRTIAGLILEQSVAIGAISFLLGYPMALLARGLFTRRVVIVPFDLGALFAVVMTICVFSSLMGVRKAMKVDPAHALGG